MKTQVLPTTTGGSITWISDFNPTSTSRPPGTPGTATPTATQAASNTDRSLSTGAKAGIGVGCSVGVLLVIGVFLWCCVTLRRKSRQHPSPSEQAYIAQQTTYPQTYLHSGSISTAQSPIAANTNAASPIGYDQQWQQSTLPKTYLAAVPGHDAFTGFKNELPADEVRPSEMSSPALEEATPSSPAGQNIANGHLDTLGSLRHEQPRQDVAGGYYLSPQSTGSETNRVDGSERDHREAPSEMQG